MFIILITFVRVRVRVRVRVDISLSDATSLLSKKNLSQEEHFILDNPLVRLNFNVIMKKYIEKIIPHGKYLHFCKNTK